MAPMSPVRYHRAMDVARHAEMLGNRVRKNHRRLRKRFAREQVDVYRLYDRDIPEVRAVVDRYGEHLVVGVYERQQTAGEAGYLEALGAAAAEALGVPADKLHLRRRRTRPSGGARYERHGDTDARFAVREGPLRFWVNLDDYLDTGLFSDHRPARRWLSERVDGKRVLNLFAYTGAFTVWAAHGGAAATTTVDASGRYLDWARDNLALNELDGPAHRTVRSDVGRFLEHESGPYDVVICDPPSFSTRYGDGDFDVLRDQRALLRQVRGLVADDGWVLFSSNHQRFEPQLDGLGFSRVEEITEWSVPDDYRNRRAHRAFVLYADAC